MTQGYKLIFLTLLTAANAAADANRYRPMAESMFDMMDAFSSAFQKRQKGQDAWSAGDTGWLQTPSQWGNTLPISPGGMGLPWGMYGSPISPANPWKPYLPGFGAERFPSFDHWRPAYPDSGNKRATSPLDGNWRGSTGEMLSIRGSRFLIYRRPEQRREGYIRVLNRERLVMQPRAGGTGLLYEYALKGDQLVLRDNQQNLLLFRRTDWRR